MSKARELARKAQEKNKGRSTELKSTGAIYNTYYEVSDNIPVWFAKGDEKGKEFYVDLVMFPYGKDFPNEVWKQPYKEGDWCYTLIADVHKGVGPEGAWVLCPKANYRERCPICEECDSEQKAIYKDESLTPEERKAKARKVWDEKRTFRRQMYFIVVRDGGEEEDKGLQFWEIPTAYMHEKLEAIKTQGRSGEVIDYYDLDYGRTIKFTVKKKGEAYAEFLGHQLEERIDPTTKKKYTIEDDFVDTAFENPLDGFLKRMTYDEVCEIYYAKSGPAAVAKDEDEAPPARSSRRRSATPVEEPEPEKEEAPPASRRRRNATAEPPPPEPENKCPQGGVFGEDCLKLADNVCDDCPEDTYAECDKLFLELEAEKKRKEEEAAASGGARKRRTRS